MADLIKRQAAINETWKEPSYTDPINVLTEIRDRIEKLPSAHPDKTCEYWDVESNYCALHRPSAQPERKTGHWIRVGKIENTWLVSKCSVCGYQTIDAGNYCTDCGAKMEAEHETN